MSDTTDQFTEQVGSFQKIWMQTFSQMAQNAFSFTPDSAPPEMLRQMRSGIFQALSQSWDEYLRSPQFMEGMKQWMDSAIAFRKMTNDFFTKARHETQDIAREDIDSIMLTVRHMEKRILDRMEELSSRLDHIGDQLDRAKTNGSVKNVPKTTAAAAAAGQASSPQVRKSRTRRQKQAKNQP